MIYMGYDAKISDFTLIDQFISSCTASAEADNICETKYSIVRNYLSNL